MTPSAVLKGVAEILHHDYYTHFKPVFDDAAAMVGGRPIEPEHEAFNALDHLAIAFLLAAEESGAEVEVQEEDRGPNDPSVHLALAKRHLVAGRYFSMEHQIAALVSRITESAVLLQHLDLDRREAIEARTEQCITRFNALPELTIPPLTDLERIETETLSFEAGIIALTELAVELGEVAVEITQLSGSDPLSDSTTAPPGSGGGEATATDRDYD